jgi:microcystin-dependent protein
MEVEGVSPERLLAVENASVVDGKVDVAGNLVLTTKGGQQKNAGSVVKPLFSWPVGSIYIGVTSTNPADLFGGGTWERFAEGRVLVGISSVPGDTEFDSVLETGGSKTVTLTEAQMPQHSHGASTGSGGVDHTHTGYTTSGGEHEHVHSRVADSRVVTGGGAATVANWNFGNYSTGGGGSHSHTVQTNGASAYSHTHSIGNSGSSQPHTNLQPYIVVYMWRRTA